MPDLFPNAKKFYTLADVIGSIESDDNPARLRFEPMLYARISGAYLSLPYATIIRAIQVANVCSAPTACMIAATSWGEWQILGENIYAPPCNYKNSIAQYLDTIEDQRLTFNRFITARNINYDLATISASPDLARRIATVYNGPGNVDDYASRILQRCK